jgi:hypothetical protein
MLLDNPTSGISVPGLNPAAPKCAEPRTTAAAIPTVLALTIAVDIAKCAGT